MKALSLWAGLLGVLSARLNAVSYPKSGAHTINKSRHFVTKGKHHHSLKVRANRRKAAKRAAYV